MESLKTFIKRFLSFLLIYNFNNEYIYLTFDDGPHTAITPELLDLLSRHNIKATFFVEGRKAQKAPNIIYNIINEGHALGYHSYLHRPINKNSWPELQKLCNNIKGFYEEFDRVQNRPIFRPPYGKLSLRAILALWLRRIRICMWSIDSEDSHHIGHEKVINNLDPAKVRTGDIILMHDDNRIAIEVLPIVIRKLKAAGFRFDTIM